MEEMSSRHGVELVTGDATRDGTLDLCNVAHARAVIAVTDSDTANLEAALGVRAFSVAERSPAKEPQPPPEDCVPLGVWRDGAFRHIDAFEESEPNDRVLFLVPLSQFESVLSENGKSGRGGNDLIEAKEA